MNIKGYLNIRWGLCILSLFFILFFPVRYSYSSSYKGKLAKFNEELTRLLKSSSTHNARTAFFHLHRVSFSSEKGCIKRSLSFWRNFCPPLEKSIISILDGLDLEKVRCVFDAFNSKSCPSSKKLISFLQSSLYFNTQSDKFKIDYLLDEVNKKNLDFRIFLEIPTTRLNVKIKKILLSKCIEVLKRKNVPEDLLKNVVFVLVKFRLFSESLRKIAYEKVAKGNLGYRTLLLSFLCKKLFSSKYKKRFLISLFRNKRGRLKIGNKDKNNLYYFTSLYILGDFSKSTTQFISKKLKYIDSLDKMENHKHKKDPVQYFEMIQSKKEEIRILSEVLYYLDGPLAVKYFFNLINGCLLKSLYLDQVAPEDDFDTVFIEALHFVERLPKQQAKLFLPVLKKIHKKGKFPQDNLLFYIKVKEVINRM